MDERDFVAKKREGWDRLAALTRKASGGVRLLSREELLELGPLYRRVSSDLAYARARAVSPDLVTHLNGLVGQAHALLYEAETSGSPVKAVVNFYMVEFPMLLQRRARYFWAAFAISVFGGLFAYWVVIHQPEKLDLIVPAEVKKSLDIWKSGKVASEASPRFSGSLMAHNQQVGLTCFAGGIVAGIPTIFMLLENGVLLGAFAAVMTQVHRHASFWPGIVPHGIAELTAIFICGGAGLLMGSGMLFPGRLSRSESLRIAALDAVRLALGTIPLFIFAGIIEGMFSRLGTPPWVRYGFAAVNGTLWYLYLFTPRRQAEKSEA